MGMNILNFDVLSSYNNSFNDYNNIYKQNASITASRNFEGEAILPIKKFSFGDVSGNGSSFLGVGGRGRGLSISSSSDYIYNDNKITM
jgi:hypothetical protein